MLSGLRRTTEWSSNELSVQGAAYGLGKGFVDTYIKCFIGCCCCPIALMVGGSSQSDVTTHYFPRQYAAPLKCSERSRIFSFPHKDYRVSNSHSLIIVISLATGRSVNTNQGEIGLMTAFFSPSFAAVWELPDYDIHKIFGFFDPLPPLVHIWN